MARLLAILLLVLAASGCGIIRKREIVRTSIQVPVAEDVTSPGRQQRTLPWATTTMRSNQRFRWDPNAPDVGVAAATARLDARRAAQEELAVKLSSLPAAKAPPGEARDLDLRTFATRGTTLPAAIDSFIREKSSEQAVMGNPGEATLQVDLPKEGLASIVLDFGGGFPPEKADEPTAPRARAAAEANARAQGDLLDKLLVRKAQGKTTIGAWAGRQQTNLQVLLAAIRRARVTRSEFVEAKDGKGGTWHVEAEFDLTKFRNDTGLSKPLPPPLRRDAPARQQ